MSARNLATDRIGRWRHYRSERAYRQILALGLASDIAAGDALAELVKAISLCVDRCSLCREVGA